MIATSIWINHEEAKIYVLNHFNPSYNYKFGHLTKSETNINTEKPEEKNPRVSEAECPDLERVWWCLPWTQMSIVPQLFFTLIIILWKQYILLSD